MNNRANKNILSFNTLRPRQDGRHFPDDIFKWIFLNELIWISIKISLNFVPKGPINNIPALVQIMAWRCPGDRPLSEPMMASLAMHICVTRPQWVKSKIYHSINFSYVKLLVEIMDTTKSYHFAFLSRLSFKVYHWGHILFINMQVMCDYLLDISFIL